MEEQCWFPLHSTIQRLLFLLVLMCIYPCCYGRDWDQRKLPCKVNSFNQSQAYDCSGKRLSKVPLGIGWNATTLDLSQNQIKELSKAPLWNLQNLVQLNLESNNLNRIEKHTFYRLDNLKTLLLNLNSFHQVPRGLPSGLLTLGLSSNNITTIRPEDFRDIPHTKTLYLSDNCGYSSVCDGPLVIVNGTFSNLTDLINLTLSFNRLSAIPPFLPPSLRLLNLSQNTINHIDQSDLRNLTNLSILDLSGNCPLCYNTPFPCLPCKTPQGELQIHPNAFSTLSQLKELRLSGNSLQSIQTSWFKNITRLQYLYLSFNSLVGEIANGDFLSVLPLVEVMDLSYNTDQTYAHNLKLSENFSKLISLKTLHLESYVFLGLCENDLKPLFNLTNLSVLNLGTNFLYSTNLCLFNKFHNLSFIDLSENKLSFLPTRVDALSVCGYGYGSDRDRFGPYIHNDGLYRRIPPGTKPECLAYGPALDLSRNSIISINSEQLRGLDNTACLNLSYNSIGDMFNGSEFTHFSRLKYLDLSHNKIYLRSKCAFSELTELEVLDLSYNMHYFVVTGLNHSLAFLEHLGSLKTLNLSWNEINTLTDKTMTSTSLQELNFQGNRLDIIWGGVSKDFYNLFTNLTNLTSLDLSFNKLHRIPPKVYFNFPKTLTRLSLSRNKLQVFHWEMLSRLPQLEELDLSKNQLDEVSHNVSTLTRSMRLLDLSYNRISQLEPGFLRGARSLLVLDLSFNQLKLINQTTFETGLENHLQQLSLQGNPLHCTCDLLDFHLWMKSNDVELPLLATSVTCDLPAETRGKSVLGYNIYACVDDENAMAFCITTSFLIFLILFVSLTVHLFYWDLTYMLDYCVAKLKHHQRSQSTNCIYDAFVMYDTEDPLVSDWVLNHLRIELEEQGERVRPLCLEERDWPPGTPIMENLSNSVQRSRKTVFVITEGFLSRGIVKMAALLVQQRLVEEGVDTMVLLLLQPAVLRRSRILYLRRHLCRRSVLEWPKVTSPAAQRWFWLRLRRAIRREEKATHTSLHSTYFTGR